MTTRTFMLLSRINAEGLDNSKWDIDMFLEPTSTKTQYGTDENIMLPSGIWLVVYINPTDDSECFDQLKPDYKLKVYDYDDALFFNVTD